MKRSWDICDWRRRRLPEARGKLVRKWRAKFDNFQSLSVFRNCKFLQSLCLWSMFLVKSKQKCVFKCTLQPIKTFQWAEKKCGVSSTRYFDERLVTPRWPTDDMKAPGHVLLFYSLDDATPGCQQWSLLVVAETPGGGGGGGGGGGKSCCVWW